MKAILTICLLLLSGCTQMRQSVIDLSVESRKNAETMREVSTSCIAVWQIQSGFLRGALGARINELPKEVIEALDELDRIALMPDIDDYHIGMFLGLKVALLNSVVQVAIQKYAPDLIDYVSLAF